MQAAMTNKAPKNTGQRSPNAPMRTRLLGRPSRAPSENKAVKAHHTPSHLPIGSELNEGLDRDAGAGDAKTESSNARNREPHARGCAHANRSESGYQR